MKSYGYAIISGILVFACVCADTLTGAQTEVSVLNAYTIPVTRDGVTRRMFVHKGWGAEKSHIVVSARSKVDRYRKVWGFESLRKLGKNRVCSIKPGIYHPVSKGNNSAIAYYTIAPAVAYVPKRDMKLSGLNIRKGDRFVDETHTYGEACYFHLQRDRSKIVSCSDLEDQNYFSRIDLPSHPAERWVYLKCKEEYKLFIKEEKLLDPC